MSQHIGFEAVCRQGSWALNLYLVVPAFFVLAGIAAAPEQIRELQWVGLSEDKSSFVLEESGESFVPWGLNYDHDEKGRLLEDYWHSEWDTVEQDFREMKQLGANVVRIHLQVGKFCGAFSHSLPD